MDEGGQTPFLTLKDRLKLFEEQKKLDEAKLNAHKTAVDFEFLCGGGILDRVKLLEYRRDQEAARLISKSSLAEISDDLIRRRLKWMDEQADLAKRQPSKRAALIVEGGNLRERLKLLAEQGRRAQEKVKPDLSSVSDEFIRERLAWMDEDAKLQSEGTGTMEEITIERGNVAKLKRSLKEEQKRREVERLVVCRLGEVSFEIVQDRLKWLQQQADTDGDGRGEQHALISKNMIAERLAWLRENVQKAAHLPEKERIEVTNKMVKQRKAWLGEQMKQARELLPKERIEVTHGLISERIEWLQAAMNRANTMSRKERSQMTTDLIAERLAYLEAQIQANTDAEAKASWEMQINFLEEKQQVAEQMTEDEQVEMTNVLITEKMQDLEQQKESIEGIAEDQQIEVTQALLEDRQAWLEGDQDHYTRRREERKRALEEAEARALEEQATIARIAEEVANSIAFWTEQKENAAEMSPPERAQITAFLVAEHIVSLEVQLEDESTNSETRESVEQQIVFLNDQLENIDDIDHLMMIDVLVQEKVNALQQMLLN